jgi:hypothetical protein
VRKPKAELADLNVLEANGFTFEQRVEAVLFGNEKLGLVGLRDQVKELRAIGRRNFVANTVIWLSVLLHFVGADDVAKAVLFRFLGLGP